MKNCFVISLFSVLINIQCAGQSEKEVMLYENKIRFFYNMLNREFVSIKDYIFLFGRQALVEEEYYFFEDCEHDPSSCANQASLALSSRMEEYESPMFFRISEYSNQLMPVNNTELEKVISNMKIYRTGIESSIDEEFDFGDKGKNVIVLTTFESESSHIINVFMADGSSIFKKLDFYQLGDYERLAIIYDPDGYTNVRSSPEVKGRVIGRINEDQLFFVNPSFFSDWWRIKTVENCQLGYMHKSRIVTFGKISPEKQDQLKPKIDLIYELSVKPCLTKLK